jgi:hypothetical protein
MPAMKIHGDLHFHFAFHRGIGPNPAMGTEQAVQVLDTLQIPRTVPSPAKGLGAFEPKAKKA